MSKCISENTANKYIDYLNKQGTVVMNTEYLNTWVGWERLSRRTRNGYATKYAKMFNTILEKVEPNTTIFCLINLVVTQSSEKHAMCWGVTQTSKGLVIEIFDPNGELSLVGWEGYVKQLTEQIVQTYSELYKENVKLTDVRKNKVNLNTVGSGNCNALVLYYIALRSQHSLSETNAMMDQSKMGMERVKKINDTITKKRSFK